MQTFQKLITPIAFAISILACTFTSRVVTPIPTEASGDLTAAPTNTVAVETQIPTQEDTTSPGTSVSFVGTSFIIPGDLGNGTQNDIVPKADGQNQPFPINPAYTRMILQGYPLQGRILEPQVLVFPAKEFAQMSESAAWMINQLQSVLAAQRASPAEQIPLLPFFNANQVFHAQERFLQFKNGTGIRFITQYDQAYLPINNKAMFYTFQGLTSDGEYYVSVIMPVNLDYLAADDKPNGPTPPEGIPFDWTNMENFPVYLNSMIERLNRTDNIFHPSLETLDALVESLLTTRQK